MIRGNDKFEWKFPRQRTGGKGIVNTKGEIREF